MESCEQACVQDESPESQHQRGSVEMLLPVKSQNTSTHLIGRSRLPSARQRVSGLDQRCDEAFPRVCAVVPSFQDGPVHSSTGPAGCFSAASRGVAEADTSRAPAWEESRIAAIGIIDEAPP